MRLFSSLWKRVTQKLGYLGSHVYTCIAGCGQLSYPLETATESAAVTVKSVPRPESQQHSNLTYIYNMEDGHVITSPNDKRKYRHIHLENGLRALLISDQKEDAGSQTDMCKDGDQKEGGNQTEPEKSGGTEGNEKMSAAALCIAVGSFSDPPDIPGLAHFLEHMVFMGSEKYPDENGFDNFIKLHAGNNNAYTDCERTVFYFDVGAHQFYEGLDRFAQFFIQPLMKPGSVDREIKAVDSEFDMSLTSDRSRKEQLLGMMTRDGHPMGKFMWGNMQTLKTTPEQENIDIYARLQDFHQHSYSAHYMTLAVQSRDDLDTLQKWVTEIFSAIPNNGKLQPSFKDQSNPFDPKKFCKLYKAIPVKNVNQVELAWSLRSLQTEYMKKPLHYLGFLIGHEGKGSLLSVLKKRLWALSLTAGNSETGFEHNSTCAMFSISITLTPLGMEHLCEVVSVVFQYLDMLRREGPQKRIYDEIKTIEDNNFRWQEQCEPSEYVEGLCENMQVYSTSHIITGDCLLYEYDPQLITSIQDELIPTKASLLFYSKNFATSGDCDQCEPWYHTRYQVEDVPLDWLSSWEHLQPLCDLHLPAENTYIATDFSLKEDDVASAVHPQLLTDTEQSKLWFKRDTKFKVPKGYINFTLKSPILGATAMSFATFDLFLHVLRENLSEVAYAADAAQLSYSLAGNSQGMTLKVSGFNHKLPKLFETIVHHVAAFTVEEDLFLTIKDQLRRVYHNKAIEPKDLALELRLSILQQPSWNVITRHACLQYITRDMLMVFVQQFKSQLFVEGYVHGNFTAKEAQDLERHLLTQINCDCKHPVVIPEVRVLQLPVGERCCRVENSNVNDNNSVIVQYFQHGPGTLREAAISELLIMRMEEPCFDILRTRLQLGYDVHCLNHNTDGIIGMSLTVCSQASKFSMPQLQHHMEAFMDEFRTMIKDMTEPEFKALVESLIMLKKCEDSHMGEEAERNWAEVLMNCYTFDRIHKQICSLEALSLEEFQKWFHLAVPETRQHRRLDIQVVGHAGSADDTIPEDEDMEEDSDEDSQSEEDEDEMEDAPESGLGAEDWERTMRLYYLSTEQQDAAVTDLQTFCDSFALYPVSKIV